MKLVIQRVQQAAVHINQQKFSSINQGLVLFVGIAPEDQLIDIEWLCNKVVKMRIFNDEQGIMNKSIQDIDGEMLIVSQFTLMASTKKGNRPSYLNAAPPKTAVPLYELFINKMEFHLGKKVATGQFGADMKIDLCNDGPVTILVDSQLKN